MRLVPGPEIAALCRKYGVRKLELFGSAPSGECDASDSDIAFFFEFDSDPTGLADRYFGLAEELAEPLGRGIDLISAVDATNPYFPQVSSRHRVSLYAGFQRGLDSRA